MNIYYVFVFFVFYIFLSNISVSLGWRMQRNLFIYCTFSLGSPWHLPSRSCVAFTDPAKQSIKVVPHVLYFLSGRFQSFPRWLLFSFFCFPFVLFTFFYSCLMLLLLGMEAVIQRDLFIYLLYIFLLVQAPCSQPLEGKVQHCFDIVRTLFYISFLYSLNGDFFCLLDGDSFHSTFPFFF